MHRTQIYLADDQYDRLRTRARRQGRTLAAVIREILDEHLAQAGTNPGAADPFDQVIGIATGDGQAVAENVADYLYGNAPPAAEARAKKPPARTRKVRRT